MKEQARRNADTPSGKEIGGLGMDSWVRWGVPAAAIAITLPAYAYQYSTFGAAQQQAFPGARSSASIFTSIIRWLSTRMEVSAAWKS
jgi:hypothetical protein